mmetsp:Transcript_34702/g.48336  ORF Transcript_34702/g.48336 Transcript_34702/m.48336 type:complete len:80 (-) Transcript_34702:40-279(-)
MPFQPPLIAGKNPNILLLTTQCVTNVATTTITNTTATQHLRNAVKRAIPLIMPTRDAFQCLPPTPSQPIRKCVGSLLCI